MREAHTDEMFVYLWFIHHKLFDKLHFLEICFLEIFERVHAVKLSQQTAVIVLVHCVFVHGLCFGRVFPRCITYKHHSLVR